MIWISSDHHVDHGNICEYAGRPFSSLEEMNEVLIENHNSVVAPDDIVYFLGDFAMGRIAESLPKAALFNGRKMLCLGNHDRPHPCNKNAGKWFDEYYKYFETIDIGGEIEIAGQMVDLCHFPYQGDSHDEDRFEYFRPEDKGRVLLHGHVHSEKWDFGERMIHVGIDSDWTEFGVKRYHPIPITAIEAAIKLKGY